MVQPAGLGPIFPGHVVVLIVSVTDDLHALCIRRALRSRGVPCVLFECDQMSAGNTVELDLGPDGSCRSARVAMTRDGVEVDVAAINVIWWRRVRADQQLPAARPTAHQIALVNNDCRGSLEGLLRTAFRGKWVSDPAATDLASNKIKQLAVAASCGFRIPETLVTQSADAVRSFSDRLAGRVIVKPVVGAAGPLLFTQFVSDVDQLDPASFAVCPAVYQEYIPGTSHIRLNCFGDRSYGALIETNALDWRPNLNVPISEWSVPESLHRRVRAVLDQLGLEMGIIDLKLTPAGEIVWLEVNPQGQFLFLEGTAGMPLSSHFADFLMAFVGEHRVRR